MSNRSLSLVTAALVLGLAPGALRAQIGTPSPEPARARMASYPARVTFGGAFGGLSGAANLNTAGTADWRLGWVGSVDGTVWLQNYVGVRASGSWAQDSIRGAALTGRGKFNKFTYDADLVLRYPIETGNGTFSPYILGGAGAISVHQLGADSTWSKFAGNVGAGLEYRFGRVGIRAEGRDFIYKFDRYGFDKTQHDIAWQGGLTLSF
ncbi:MAG TPA: outer membrane beta-barrel protein [Gemmatimonadales bacterium]|nr:outer membrane beta-barrel protein [Gemmatimonadales bacterium]